MLESLYLRCEVLPQDGGMALRYHILIQWPFPGKFAARLVDTSNFVLKIISVMFGFCKLSFRLPGEQTGLGLSFRLNTHGVYDVMDVNIDQVINLDALQI